MHFEFFPGLHQPNHAANFDRACISINRLRGRKKPIGNTKVLLDSGAFTELERFGRYRHSVVEYAIELWRLYSEGVVNISAAVSQDYMCESFMLEKTGLTVLEHQFLTIERYDELLIALRLLFPGGIPFEVMPILQGFTPAEYERHIEMYGPRLETGMWVGVGSVCKRQGKPESIKEVLRVIKKIRPDLKLHGFGVKKTALKDAEIRSMFTTADSMAWSFAARKQGRNQNDWREAKKFEQEITQCGKAA